LEKERAKHKRAEETLSGLMERLRLMYESVTDGITVTDSNGVITNLNKRAAEIHGFSSMDELLGKHSWEFIARRDRQKAAAQTSQVLQEGKSRAVEYTLLRADGSEFPGEISASVLKDASGNLIGFIGITRDITKRKSAEEALRKSEEKYRKQFDEVMDAIFVADVETGILIDCNRAACELVGWEKAELVGKPQRDLHPPKKNEGEFSRTFKQHLKEKEGQILETQVITKKGEIKDVAIKAKLFELRGRKVLQGSFRDITERKRSEKERARLSHDLLKRVKELRCFYSLDIAVEESRSIDEFLNRVVSLIPLAMQYPELARSGITFRSHKYQSKDFTESKCSISAHIKVTGRVMGSLGVYYSEERPFLKEEVDLVTGLAERIGKVVEGIEAKEMLQENEKRFRALIENSSDIIQVVDSKGVIRYVSPSVQRILGYRPEELIGRPSVDIVHPDDLPIVARGFKEALEKPEVPQVTVCRCKHKDGTWRLIEGIGVNQLDNPAVNGFIANMHDITERKQAVEALRKSEQNYRILFESKLDGVCVIDETMKLLLANQVAADMFGFDSLEEMLDVNPFDFIPRKERERLLAIVTKDMFEKDLKQVNEFQLMTKAGKEIWLSAVGARIEYQGKSAGLVSFRDITARKRDEEGIKYQRKYFQALFEGSPEAVASLDPQNRVMDINPTFEKMFGYTLEDIKGRDIDDCILPTSKKEEGRSFIRRAWEGEVAVAWSVRKRADGTKIPVSILGAPIILDGKQIGMFAIYRDITERKKAREQLERSFVDLAGTVSRAMASRDPYTAGHQQRVAKLARLVGEKIGLDKNRLQGLYIGGLLHDIGKVSTPESILSKPGRLTHEEQALVHAHAKQGYKILKGTNLPWPIADMALHHHERVDGSGYPDGISGDKISLENRILGVCDVVEAMSSFRPYRPAKSIAEILKELRSGRGTKYDADVVDVMLELIESGEFEIGKKGEFE